MTQPTLIPAVRHPLSTSIHPGALDGVAGLDVVEASADDEVVARLRDGAQVLFTHAWRDEFLQPSLRWVQGEGAGYEQYPVETFVEYGIVLTTARGVHACVAETAIGLLLALTRGIGRSVRDAPERRWAPTDAWELAGTTVGILGLGTIGEQVARRLVGWEVELVGCKRDPSTYDGVVPTVLPATELTSLCSDADVLILTVPDGEDNAALIGAPQLDALGAGWFVNVGRGRTVDEDALVDALTRGKLRGAGLDVFAVEPLPPTSPLWDLDNVVLTPHVGGRSQRYGEKLAEIVTANASAFRAALTDDPRSDGDVPPDVRAQAAVAVGVGFDGAETHGIDEARRPAWVNRVV